MVPGSFEVAHQRLAEAVDQLGVVAGPSGGDDELLSVLRLCEGVARRLDQITVDTIAVLIRRGVFTERGYKSPIGALGDLLGWDRSEARRRVIAAEQVCVRTGLDGTELPAKLDATADAFTAGKASLRHVEVIARLLNSAAAGRLAPDVWAGVEEQLAGKTGEYSPSELHTWGTTLIELLDQDGAEPDDRELELVNELHLVRK